MKEMEYYHKRLENIKKCIASEDYNGAVRLGGKTIELGLKDLYTMMADDEHSKDLINTLQSYKERFDREFNPERATLGSLLRIYSNGNVWDVIRKKVDSNLFYTEMMPWSKILERRNMATHNKHDFNRHQALEILHYVKVFLYDCCLVSRKNGFPETTEAEIQKCRDCKCNLLPDWNFCPQCGATAFQLCLGCNKRLEPNWSICPSCNLPRESNIFLREKKALFRIYCEAVWADKIKNAREKKFLEEKRLELGISPSEANEIETEVMPSNYQHFIHLIEAVMIDGILDQNEFEFLINKAQILGFDTVTSKEIIQNLYPDINLS